MKKTVAALCALAFSVCEGLAQSKPLADAPKHGERESKAIKTESGLVYEDTVVGAGASPALGETCVVDYTGWIWVNGAKGTKFDSSLNRGGPFEFPIGRGRVIKGWDEGVATMKVGGKRTLLIPPHLAYGDRGAGNVIPPNATLLFEVELLGPRGRGTTGRSAPAPQPRSSPRSVAFGSGVRVSRQGHVLTNNHVIDGCEVVSIDSVSVEVIARDRANDIALLKERRPGKVVAPIRSGVGIRPGEGVVVLGFPLPSVLSTEIKVTTGVVSALSGPGETRSLFQISAPLQPGNSGGPVFDDYGSVVGLAVARLRDRPEDGNGPNQMVNFAVAAGTIRSFLESQFVSYTSVEARKRLEPVEITERMKDATVQVICK